MTYGDFERRLTEILQQPDSALANIKPLMDDVKADYESIITLTDAKNKNEARIRDLQDTNMKLFLAQTAKSVDEKHDDDELEGPDAIDAFVDKLNKEDN